jgi:hypothetical protein
VAELETVTAIVPAPAAARRTVESDWFRRGEEPAATAGAQPPASSWAPPADYGAPAARAAIATATGTGLTDTAIAAGLPRRTPNANLAPGMFGWPASEQGGRHAVRARNLPHASGARHRSPQEVGSRLAEFQRGANQARTEAPWNLGERS